MLLQPRLLIVPGGILAVGPAGLMIGSRAPRQALTSVHYQGCPGDAFMLAERRRPAGGTAGEDDTAHNWW
jgi:hypothetical protein